MSAIVGRRVIAFGTKPKAGNYAHVSKTTRNGIKFDSKKEADRYTELLILDRAGRIRNLRLQVLYRLEVNGVLIAKYTADFVYEEDQGRGEWLEITEDVKGYPNERWPMKRKLFRALFGREIRVT